MLEHTMDIALVKKQGYVLEYNMVDMSTLVAPELAPVAVSDKCRGLAMLMPRMRRIREFKLYEVHKHFGISLIEFLSMSREDVELIVAELQNDGEIISAKKAELERKALEEARTAGKNPDFNGINGRFPDNL